MYALTVYAAFLAIAHVTSLATLAIVSAAWACAGVAFYRSMRRAGQ